MFRLNKILIKRGFKSTWKSKAFSILMIILIIITGSVYTMLSSSANAFKLSYDNVIKNGNLHDYIIKSNFVTSSEKIKNSQIKFLITNFDDKKPQIIGERNDELLFTNSKINLEKIKENKIKFKIKIICATNIFKEYNEQVKEYNLSIQDKKVEMKDYKEQFLNFTNNWKANIISQIKKTLADKFVECVRKDYSDKLYIKNTESLYVESKKNSYKIVLYEKPFQKNNKILQKVNTIVKYDGVSVFTKKLTDEQFAKQLEYQVKSNDKIWEDYRIDKTKSYKQIAIEKNEIYTKPFTLFDPSSYQAIISPAYANQNNKKSIDINEIAKYFSKNHDFIKEIENKNSYFSRKYKNNIIYVDETPYFITGIGTTPDFIYPILDNSKPIVNNSNQVILFVNRRGYDRIHDAFSSNLVENYISIKFKPKVSEKEKKQILKEIELNLKNGEKQGNQKNIYPKNAYAKMPGIKLITKYNDLDDQMLLTQERVLILDKVQSTVSSLAYITTTLLILFFIFISIMIFKTLASVNKKVYATLHALGYFKSQIAISNALTAFIIVFIPMAISYGIGYGMQFIFMNRFSSIWTIPAYVNSFSWMTFLIMMVIPTIIMFIIIFFTTLYELKGPLPTILNGGNLGSYKWIVKITSKFKLLGIKSKYVFALTTKNMGKLILIIITSIISMTSIMIGIGTLGKANQAYEATTKMNNYEFAISLITPSKEGGIYRGLKPYKKEINKDDQLNRISQIKNVEQIVKNPNENHWFIPNSQNLKYVLANQAKKPNNIYRASKILENTLQHKASLKIGKEGKIDPWKIAERLMPDNQRNQANKDYKKIFKNNIDDKKVIKNKLNELIKKKDQTPYIISYKNIIINEKDELFTYIEGFLYKKRKKISIQGINDETKMIAINSKKLKNLNRMFENNNKHIPILVNKYIAEYWDVKKGSILKFKVENTFDKSILSDKKSNKKLPLSLKIIDIVEGYNDLGIYTTKKIANKVLSMKEEGFNGIFTKSKKPKALSTLSLYSKSGIYPATDAYRGNWNTFLKNYLKSKEWKNKNVVDSLGNKIKNVEQFINKYSEIPYQSLVSKVRWNAIDKSTFKNVKKISATIINIIETISIFLSILFTIIVSILLFKINRKKISTLWAMGYRKKEISKMFLSIYLMPIIIAIIIAIPISYAVISAMKLFIMNFGNILIPLKISWWMPIITFIAIGSIFIFSTIITIYSQKSNFALESFKGN